MTDSNLALTTPPATLDFTPVPRRRRRHDGWTAACQRAFIAALAETGSVSAACRAVGKTNATAYRLYNHPQGASLRAAWDHALAMGGQRLHDIAMERIAVGVPSPVFFRGEQVGERRLFSNTLLVQMIKHYAGGYAASPVGHRSRAAQERFAAENCPECRERRAAEADAEADCPSAEEEEEEETAARELYKRYAWKIVAERRHRLAGEVTAADFTLRQITALEIMLEGGGMAELLRAAWGDGMGAMIAAAPSDLTRELDAIKQRIWAEADDPPRPPQNLAPDARRDSAIHGGPTIMQRHAIQRAAQARIAEAQAEWEAAAREETWAAWLAGRA